jgi:hypothetical protein
MLMRVVWTGDAANRELRIFSDFITEHEVRTELWCLREYNINMDSE